MPKVNSPQITGYDHVGIRVSDAERALSFYGQLGFRVDRACSNDQVAEIVSEAGTRINLIFNGQSRPQAHNILMDGPTKWPGHTHGAFVVESMNDLLEWAASKQIIITEGPVNWGRRVACFLRDPDGNVLEFNELLPSVDTGSSLKPTEGETSVRTAISRCDSE